MKRKRLDPHSPEVTARVVAKIERMTPEDALAFLFYREPGVPDTDMLGVLEPQEPPLPERERQMLASSVDAASSGRPGNGS